jgi:hypothetical protein
MAAYQTRKQGTEARSRTIANRTARALKQGATNVNRAGHVRTQGAR